MCIRKALVVLVVPLALSACGGSDDDPDEAATETTGTRADPVAVDYGDDCVIRQSQVDEIDPGSMTQDELWAEICPDGRNDSGSTSTTDAADTTTTTEAASAPPSGVPEGAVEYQTSQGTVWVAAGVVYAHGQVDLDVIRPELEAAGAERGLAVSYDLDWRPG